MANASYSQSKSKNESASSSVLMESKLSKEQAKILEKREEQYQEYFFPEIINQLNESTKTGVNMPMFASTARGINASAGTAKGQLAASMAKRGIEDSGMAAAGELSIEQAKGASMAEAFFGAQLSQKQQVMNMLQMGGGESPKPTTAAPIGSDSTSYGVGHSKSMSAGGGIGSGG